MISYLWSPLYSVLLEDRVGSGTSVTMAGAGAGLGGPLLLPGSPRRSAAPDGQPLEGQLQQDFPFTALRNSSWKIPGFEHALSFPVPHT